MEVFSRRNFQVIRIALLFWREILEEISGKELIEAVPEQLDIKLSRSALFKGIFRWVKKSAINWRQLNSAKSTHAMTLFSCRCSKNGGKNMKKIELHFSLFFILLGSIQMLIPGYSCGEIILEIREDIPADKIIGEVPIIGFRKLST